MRHIHNASKMKIAAVLDLQAAYDTVHGDMLYDMAKEKIDDRTMKMIGFSL